jgi:low affinity Fe/Cu permease
MDGRHELARASAAGKGHDERQGEIGRIGTNPSHLALGSGHRSTNEGERGMPSSQQNEVSKTFGDLANHVARAAGRPAAFVIAVAIVIVWAGTGPIFNYSDTWQLIINTGTTIVTFLMVFLIQNSQNRDNAAIQVKLDELIRVSEAKNLFVGIEHLTEEEIEELRSRCEARAKAEGDRAVRRIDKVAQAAAESAG